MRGATDSPAELPSPVPVVDLADGRWSSKSPPNTARRGAGRVLVAAGMQRALDVGLVPGLSVDVETTVPSDMFSQMRALLGIQRMRGSLGNPTVERPQLTARDVLSFATRDGARIVGLERDCGTLTPGKKADIVLLDCTEPNTFPLNNAYGTAVMGADISSVRVVMVSGVIKKWGHTLVDVDLGTIRSMVEDSRNYLASRVGYEIDLFADYPSVELPEASLRT